jgi:hypothetical protein
MKKLFILIFLPVFVMLIGGPAWGAIYVKKVGSDFFTGTVSCEAAATAADDLEHAVYRAGENDGTLFICAGTYTGTDLDADSKITATHTGLTIRNLGNVILDADGNSTAPLTAANRATFSVIGTGGEGAFIIRGGTAYGVQVYASSTNTAVDIEGVTVTGSSDCDTAGIGVQGDITAVISGTISGNWVSGVRGMGIDAANSCQSLTINGNIIVGVGDHLTLGQHGISVHATPTIISSGGSNWTSEGGDIYSTTVASEVYGVVNSTDDVALTENDGNFATLGAGEFDWDTDKLYINIGEDGDNVSIAYTIHENKNNIISENDVSGTYDTGGDEGHGIAMDGFNWDNQIIGNYVHGNLGEGIQVNFGEGTIISNNLIIGNLDHGIGLLQATKATTKVQILNNTILNSGTAAILVRKGRQAVEIKNTILKGSGTYGINQEDAGDTVDADYNCYDDNTSGDVAIASKGANAVTTDPQLTATYSSPLPAIYNGGTDVGLSWTYSYLPIGAKEIDITKSSASGNFSMGD